LMRDVELLASRQPGVMMGCYARKVELELERMIGFMDLKTDIPEFVPEYSAIECLIAKTIRDSCRELVALSVLPVQTVASWRMGETHAREALRRAVYLRKKWYTGKVKSNGRTN
jgi:hypothetical protein